MKSYQAFASELPQITEAIQNPNSSGQGFDPDHADNPHHGTILKHGYEYSHSTPVVYKEGDRRIHHTYKHKDLKDHAVGVTKKAGGGTTFDVHKIGTSGPRFTGGNDAALDKHLKGHVARAKAKLHEGVMITEAYSDVLTKHGYSPSASGESSWDKKNGHHVEIGSEGWAHKGKNKSLVATKGESEKSLDSHLKAVASRQRAAIAKKSRESALSSLGLTKVKGAMGGTYWESEMREGEEEAHPLHATLTKHGYSKSGSTNDDKEHVYKHASGHIHMHKIFVSKDPAITKWDAHSYHSGPDAKTLDAYLTRKRKTLGLAKNTPTPPVKFESYFQDALLADDVEESFKPKMDRNGNKVEPRAPRKAHSLHGIIQAHGFKYLGSNGKTRHYENPEGHEFTHSYPTPNGNHSFSHTDPSGKKVGRNSGAGRYDVEKHLSTHFPIKGID